MRARLGSSGLFLLFTYMALSGVPFLPFLLGRSVENPARILGIEALAWLACWAAFSRPKWFHPFLLPAFLALPVEIYLQTFFNQGISTHHLGILAETSPRESMEFVGDRLWLLMGTALVVLIWWGLAWRAALKTNALVWTNQSRWLAIAAFTLALAAWMYEQEFGSTAVAASSVNAKGASDSSAAGLVGGKRTGWNLPPLPAWSRIPTDSTAFARTWPFGLVARGYDFWKERQYLAELSHKSRSFTFGAQQTLKLATPQLVVMVIGESSRYDRWSLNGYGRETNPLLKNEQHLISLSNVITAVSATRLSVPVLVSRKPATQSLKAGFAEKSFLSAFREAGFKTYWISNQMSFGQFDTPVSVFAREADVTQFLNLGGFNSNTSYDEVLLDPLKAAVADPAQKKLIVLHTLGNHWNYSHRHPKEYDKWQPSLFGVEKPAYTDSKIKEQLNNSYDNSILYTDWFLSQVIQTLKSSRQMAAMMYVADHGQTLYDGSCNLAFHGHNTQYEFHVPALVWHSDLYRITHPGKVNQLLKNRRSRLTTENVFHSLVDMADIHYGSEQLERSFLSKEFRQHKRYVDSYGWTDYDNATFRGDCREVIDRGTPLRQEK